MFWKHESEEKAKRKAVEYNWWTLLFVTISANPSSKFTRRNQCKPWNDTVQAQKLKNLKTSQCIYNCSWNTTEVRVAEICSHAVRAHQSLFHSAQSSLRIRSRTAGNEFETVRFLWSLRYSATFKFRKMCRACIFKIMCCLFLLRFRFLCSNIWKYGLRLFYARQSHDEAIVAMRL